MTENECTISLGYFEKRLIY